MSLENWQKFGWLKAHKTSRAEIVELVGIADRDIEASNTEDLHDETSPTMRRCSWPMRP